MPELGGFATTNVDNVTIETNASSQIQVKDGSVTADKLGSTIASMILVEEYTLINAGTSFDFTSALNGNTDQCYIIESIFTPVAGNISIGLRLNGSACNGDINFLYGNGGTLSGGFSNNSNVYFTAIINQLSEIIFKINNTKNTGGRICMAEYNGVDKINRGCGTITTPATNVNITSIGLVGSANFPAGTKFRLYKRVV